MTAQLVHAVLLDLALGVCLGTAGGMLGIGGGLIAIPVLGILYGMDQHLAQGTALVMIAPNVLIGFLRYRQRNHIDMRATLWMGMLATISSYIGGRIASHLNAQLLQSAFATFLIVLATYFVLQQRFGHSGEGRAPILSKKLLPVLGVASGGMSGVFTVGGGLIVVPALVTLFGLTQTQAQGVALALVVPGAVAALFSYAQGGHVDWMVGIPLALGGIASVSWGVALAHKFPPERLRLLFCVVLYGTAGMMLALR
ncbi:sulfite exporter TauE/SafE family protein [Janthinobacterium sp. 17J80-10]|uniref:sulfite exporter TauE/SafE family protein n=1 Tax=Janthinobacterium sp. 17J80-10 TaxID=2497863 RepID=UPI0010058D3E|nr:sulfite exporter TauE/SafE family protein [Janthinobacterium sp. 17J80-10]QAU34535.1 sulfite exporter TauE/SafE family protein [Janthinobacterium sp. 17J80-10]